MKYDEKPKPEPAVSILDSCILLCDVIIAGKESAVALKYDEENMFAPMILLLEKGASADELILAAENLGVPVMKNAALAKKLMSYGKMGSVIPEQCYRDVSLVLARAPSAAFPKRTREFKKTRQGIPVKARRPISLELGTSIFALTDEEPGREKLLAEPLNVMRKKLVRLMGISIPAFRVFQSRTLKSDEYRVLFRGLEAGRGRLELGWYSSVSSGDWRNSTAIPDLMQNPENLKIAARAAACALVNHTNEIIKRRGPELLGRDEVEAILDAAEEKYPVVTGEVRNLLSLGIIREILMSLVSEQVSIRHIAVILETLADWGSFGPAPSDLIIEQIRQSLKRQICLEYTDDRMTLRVLTLEPRLEKRLAEQSRGETDTGFGAKPAETSADWADFILPAIKRMEERGLPPVILCSPKARSPLKEATRRKIPELAVLSYLEIPTDIVVEPEGEIRLEENFRFPGVGNELNDA